MSEREDIKKGKTQENRGDEVVLLRETTNGLNNLFINGGVFLLLFWKGWLSERERAKKIPTNGAKAPGGPRG